MTILSPDALLYTEEGEYLWTRRRVRMAWEKSFSDFDALLKWGRRPTKLVLMVGAKGAGKTTWLASNKEPGALYWDACLNTPEKRGEIVGKARAVIPDLPVEVVWMDTPLSLCLERNAGRTPDRRTPERDVERVHRILSENPPTDAEGFSKITRVTPQ